MYLLRLREMVVNASVQKEEEFQLWSGPHTPLESIGCQPSHPRHHWPHQPLPRG